MNIVLYGQVDKRPLVLSLIKLLQDFGSVAFITPEYHYRRLIDGSDNGYFQNTLVCSSTDSPLEIFTNLNISPNAFDFVIWDSYEYLPDDIDMAFACSGYLDEFIFDQFLTTYPQAVEVKFNYDNKIDKEVSNIKVTPQMLQYVEMAESLKILPPIKDRSIIKLFETCLASHLDINPKSVAKLLAKQWSE